MGAPKKQVVQKKHFCKCGGLCIGTMVVLPRKRMMYVCQGCNKHNRRQDTTTK